MSLNIRTKGQNGEREVAGTLEQIIRDELQAGGYPIPEKPIVQRNQNQSAVGGSDLSNTFDLCIEIKRQEALAVNAWWAQCVEAARHNNEEPVLVFRQNRKQWRVVLRGMLPLPNGDAEMMCRVEISWADFQEWFRLWVRRQLLLGYQVRV